MASVTSIETDVERIADVERRIGLKKSRIYALIQEGAFPAPFHVGKRAYWTKAEIIAWLQEHVAERDSRVTAAAVIAMNKAARESR